MTYTSMSPARMHQVDIDDVVGVPAPRWVIRSRRRAGRGRASRSTTIGFSIGRTPASRPSFFDDVTGSRKPRPLVRPQGTALTSTPRIAQRHLRQPPQDRVAQLQTATRSDRKYKLSYLEK